MTELDAIAHVPTVAQYDFAYQKNVEPAATAYNLLRRAVNVYKDSTPDRNARILQKCKATLDNSPASSIVDYASLIVYLRTKFGTTYVP